MNEQTTVNDLANEICRDLPEGYVLSIEMEKGSGSVELRNPEGERIDPAEFNTYEGIVEDVRRALEFAEREAAVNGWESQP